MSSAADGERAAGSDLVALLDHLPAFVAHRDRDVRNLFANRVALDWFGIDPAAMHGRHLRDVIGPEVYASRLHHVQAVLAGEPRTFERDMRDPRGRLRHLHVSFVPHRVGGAVAGFFALATDITDRVVVERELQERTAELARSSDREQAAARIGALVARHLFDVALELSAGLQDGPHDRTAQIRSAIGHIEDSIRQLRTLLGAFAATRPPEGEPADVDGPG